MKISNIISATLLALAIAAPAALRAESNTISPYSRFGYGILAPRSNSMQKGMGGVGYAMRSGREINFMNPASYAAMDSLTFLFDHKVILKIQPKADVSLEDLELELIDYGVDELEADEEGAVVLYGAFEEYSNIQQYLESNGYEILSTEFVRIPNDLKEVTDEQRESIEKLLEKLEEDDDVQNVFHNMAD